MRHCGACGRPIPDHPFIGAGSRRARFCPIKPADTEDGKPQRYVYDPAQVAKLRGVGA